MSAIVRSPWLIVGVPVIFVLLLWASSDGLPYFKDANKSSLMYIHAWTLVNSHPLTFSFLTALDLSPETREPTLIYLNNPNLPRYVHYVLFLLGISSFKLQLLAITLVGSAASFWFLYRFFGTSLSILVALPLLCDFVGSQYLTNSYRVFCFILFFGCLLSLKSGRLIPLAFFALWQFEYGFALFMSVTCGVMFFSNYRRWLLAAASSVCRSRYLPCRSTRMSAGRGSSQQHMRLGEDACSPRPRFTQSCCRRSGLSTLHTC